MSMHADTSVQVAWAIANAEAQLSGSSVILPIHFFLGILKVVDPRFPDHLHSVDLPEPAVRALPDCAKAVRQYLEMSADEAATLRRSIRGSLRKGKLVRPSEQQMLHRSARLRAIFAYAGQRAAAQGGRELSLLNLVEALFETGSIVLESPASEDQRHPGSRGARWEVDEEGGEVGRFIPWLGRNLTELAARKRLPPFVGRRRELLRVVRGLSKPYRQNVALVGGAGTGKTAIVEGVARYLRACKDMPESAGETQVLEIHGTRLAAECESEAELSRRLGSVFHYLRSQKAPVLFIDDLHGLFPLHLQSDTTLSLLISLTSESVFPCIVATTEKAWRSLAELNPSLLRCFQVSMLSAPTDAEMAEIADAWITHAFADSDAPTEEGVRSIILEVADRLPSSSSKLARMIEVIESIKAYSSVSAVATRSRARGLRVADVRSAIRDQYGIEAA